MNTSVVCPNPRCPQPTNVKRIVLSGATNASPGSMGPRYRRRTVNRRLMQSRMRYLSWGPGPGVTAVLVTVGLAMIAYGLAGPGTTWELIGGIVALVVAVAVTVWSIRTHAHPGSSSLRRRHAEPAAQPPTDLYYCDGCGNVFDPVSGKFVPLDRAAAIFA